MVFSVSTPEKMSGRAMAWCWCSTMPLCCSGLFILRIRFLPGDALGASLKRRSGFQLYGSVLHDQHGCLNFSGESSLSNFSQMAAITFLMSISATTECCGGQQFIHADSAERRPLISAIGQVDFTRVLYRRLFLPLCFLMALIYVWQGMPQTLSADAIIHDPRRVKQQ